MKRVSPLETWKNLEDEYPTLCTLARALMVLPCSTVAVERAFSSLKNIKIPKRNRLTVQNLEACLLTYQNLDKRQTLACQAPENLATSKVLKFFNEDQGVQPPKIEEDQLQIFNSQEILLSRSEGGDDDNDDSELANVIFIPSQNNLLKRKAYAYQRNIIGEKKVLIE